MKYEKEDFEGMMYNIHALKLSEDLSKMFHPLNTVFSKFTEFCNDYGGINKVLRYIIYCYDKNSPLHRINDYKTKKITAAQMAGYPYDEKRGITDVKIKSMIEGKSTEINSMIVLYLRHTLQTKWASTVLMIEAYYSAAEEILNEGFDKDAIKVIRELRGEIDDSLQELFVVKTDKILEETALMVIEEEKYGLKPEDIAERIQNGSYIGI